MRVGRASPFTSAGQWGGASTLKSADDHAAGEQIAGKRLKQSILLSAPKPLKLNTPILACSTAK